MTKLHSARRAHILLGLFFVLGFFYRLLLARWVPQPRIWDQDQYYGFALGMLQESFHGDTVRLYGYPVLIVPFIHIFGESFQWYLTIFQALLDSLTGLIVFRLGLSLFSKKAAWFGYILYLANPFTSAYVGVVLTEIPAIFLVTLILYIFVGLFGKWATKSALLAGLLLGFLPQVRPSFQFLTFILFSWLIARAIREIRVLREKRKSIVTLFLIIVVYLVPYSYNVFVNVYRYHQFALQSVDNVFIREVYISLFIDRAAPPGDTMFAWPNEVYRAWWDFSSPVTPDGRKAISEKYTTLAIAKIQSDPIWFLRSRIAKAWYIWEKHYLFPYIRQPGGVAATLAIYWANTMVLLMAAGGLILWYAGRRIRADIALRRFGLLVIVLVLYLSIAHVFSTSEERFSLPAYPIIILFAGFVLYRFTEILKRRVPH